MGRSRSRNNTSMSKRATPVGYTRGYMYTLNQQAPRLLVVFGVERGICGVKGKRMRISQPLLCDVVPHAGSAWTAGIEKLVLAGFLQRNRRHLFQSRNIAKSACADANRSGLTKHKDHGKVNVEDE